MALQIEQLTHYGVTANYWKLQSSKIDWHNKSLSVVFAGYRDELSRQNGMQPLAEMGMSFNGDDFPLSMTEAENVPTMIYETAKLNEFFTGAIDV